MVVSIPLDLTAGNYGLVTCNKYGCPCCTALAGKESVQIKEKGDLTPVFAPRAVQSGDLTPGALSAPQGGDKTPRTAQGDTVGKKKKF